MVCNIRNYGTPSVVQHVFALMLALVTRMSEHQQAVQQGKWRAQTSFALLDYPFTELAGKTLGIVGYGVLGQAVAKVAAAFGMQVLVSARPHLVQGQLLDKEPEQGSQQQDSRPARIPLVKLLPQVDVLSLHCPLTDNNQNLINATTLAMMKSSALIINTARGGLIHETALADALAHGRLGGAGLDVLSVEPPQDDNPLMQLALPNLIITPHIAWAAQESRQRLLNQIGQVINAYLQGTPMNQVN